MAVLGIGSSIVLVPAVHAYAVPGVGDEAKVLHTLKITPSI